MTFEIALILLAAVTVVLSALFAGAETGVYQLSSIRLRLGIERKQLPFVILGKAMRDKAGLLLSLLIANNVTHYIVTSIVTYMFLKSFNKEHTAELFATLITAPVLFVFAELIPKNIFYYRADYLMPRLSVFLFAFDKLLTWCGAKPLLQALSRVFMRIIGVGPPTKTPAASTEKPHIMAILEDLHEEAVLSPVQSEMMSRLAMSFSLRISSVMIPISSVRTVAYNSGRTDLLKILRDCAFTRLPVYRDGFENIAGFVNIYDCLSTSQEFSDLSAFIRPIRRLSSNTSVSDAINIMRNENLKIVLVTKAAHSGLDKPAGIITMKDLVEELIGELAEW